MKRLTQIFQALLGVVALILTALVAVGRLVWRTIRNCWNSCGKWFCRTAVAATVLIFGWLVCIVAYNMYDRRHGRRYWEDMAISENIVVHAFRDGKCRVYNRCTGKYTTPKINWVSDIIDNDSIIVYAIPGKRGYINRNTGEIVIDANRNNYSKAWVFSEGMAAVMKDGRVGFINPDNEIVIPFKYQYVKKDDVRLDYIFKNGYCVIADSLEKCGLIDTTGNWAFRPAYDYIWTPDSFGYIHVINDFKYGLLDRSLKLLYPVEYDCINVVGNDGVPELVLTRDGRMWKEDSLGNVIAENMFDATFWLKYPSGYSNEGDIVYEMGDYMKYQIGNMYGLLNRKSGKLITPAIYCDINMLSPTLFEMQLSGNGKWIGMDVSGRVTDR